MFAILGRRLRVVATPRVLGAGLASACFSSCVLKGRQTPVLLEDGFSKALSKEVSRELIALEQEAEKLVTKAVDTLEKTEMGKVLEQEIVDYIVHPLRDTAARFAPYANYLAYSSDIGESFRMIAAARMVNASYALAGLYCFADVGYNGYAEYGKSKGDMNKVGMTVAHSAVFQGVASLFLPYIIIHNAVHQSNHRLFKASSSAFLRNWGSSGVALCIIPFLPMVDGPVEMVVDWLFDHMVPHTANNVLFEKQKAEEL